MSAGAPSDEPPKKLDPAQARIAAILNDAIPPVDTPLEDEIRRLMLHLSREPMDEQPALRVVATVHPRTSFLRRLFGRRSR